MLYYVFGRVPEEGALLSVCLLIFVCVCVCVRADAQAPLAEDSPASRSGKDKLQDEPSDSAHVVTAVSLAVFVKLVGASCVHARLSLCLCSPRARV